MWDLKLFRATTTGEWEWEWIPVEFVYVYACVGCVVAVEDGVPTFSM
jgi:hypothetical protein